MLQSLQWRRFSERGGLLTWWLVLWEWKSPVPCHYWIWVFLSCLPIFYFEGLFYFLIGKLLSYLKVFIKICYLKRFLSPILFSDWAAIFYSESFIKSFYLTFYLNFCSSYFSDWVGIVYLKVVIKRWYMTFYLKKRLLSFYFLIG